MVKISAVIMTYNEERNITRCLQSIKGVVDEIVVVDSFSTYQTEILCNPFDVRFITHPFDGYIEQRQWAVQQASFNYILAIDADEVLSEPLRKAISAVKNNWQADGYSFNRLTNYLGKWIRHSGWYPDVKLRLWDRRKGAIGGTNPHDKVIMQADSVLNKIDGDLLHYSYHSIRQHLNQINSFTEIAAKEAVAKSKKISTFGIIVKTIWKFKRDYFLKLGFLDGYYGFVVCSMSAYAVFVKYLKMKEMNRQSVKMKVS